jgi:hypothetical protein
MSVIKSDWEKIDKSFWTPIFGESFYAAGAFFCMRAIARWADRRSCNDPIEYVFERGAEGQVEVENMLRFVGRDPDLKALFRLNTWSFGSKRNLVLKKMCFPAVIPLQAADYLAYESYRQLDNRVVDGIKLNRYGKEIPMRESFRCLLQRDKPAYKHLDDEKVPIPHYIGYCDEEALLKMLELCRREVPMADAFDADDWWRTKTRSRGSQSKPIS